MLPSNNNINNNGNPQQRQQRQQQQWQTGGAAAASLDVSLYGTSSTPTTSSYQQQQQQQSSPNDTYLGPGMSRIMSRLEQRGHGDGDDENNEDSMRRRTRILYMVLGVLLLGFYYFMWQRKPFRDPFHLKHNKKHDDHNKQKQQNQVDSTSIVEEDELFDTTSSIPLLGKSHKHDKKDKDPTAVCTDGRYSKRTLKRAYELPFAGLFQDTKGQKKYEASSVILADNNNNSNNAYAICDNSWSIYQFGSALKPFDATNKMIGDPNREQGEDSGYEALFYDSGTFYVLRESVLHEKTQSYHAIIEELELGDDDYTVVDTCSSAFEFEGDSKGFEGAIALRDTNNELVVLGLCEGNHCSEKRKFDVGHGEFVAMKKKKGTQDNGTTSPCLWETIRKIKIPSSAKFRDYSAATMDDKGRVAISTQEDSAVWIGQLLGRDEATGLWDLDKLEFDPKIGEVYQFPKNDKCETVYCNVEGIHWINNEMLMAVSDKMKSKGKQDFQYVYMYMYR